MGTYRGVAIKWLALAALSLVLIVWIGSRFAGGQHGRVRQAEATAGAAVAMQEAGQVAVATVLDQSREEVALKDLVREASKEIDDAPTPAAARAATLGAACQLRLYRDDPACQLRPADPARVGGGSGRTPAP